MAFRKAKHRSPTGDSAALETLAAAAAACLRFLCFLLWIIEWIRPRYWDRPTGLGLPTRARMLALPKDVC